MEFVALDSAVVGILGEVVGTVSVADDEGDEHVAVGGEGEVVHMTEVFL